MQPLEQENNQREAVLDFLLRLTRWSLEAAGHVTYRPTGWDDLYEFVIPARVVSQREADDYRRRIVLSSRQATDTTLTDHGYQPLFTDDGLLSKGEKDYHPPAPRLHSSVLEEKAPDVNGLIACWGEPGEGKTTALWYEVARQARCLHDNITQGKVALDHPSYRVPLAITLANLQA